MSKVRAPSILVLLVFVALCRAAAAAAQAPAGADAAAARGLALVGSGTAAGQEAPNRPSWGTSDKIFHPVLHPEFTPANSLVSWSSHHTFGLFPGSAADATFYAPVHLPSGALLTDLELDYIDEDLADSVSLTFHRCNVFLLNCSVLGQLNSNTGPGGRGFVVANLTSQSFTVDNASQKLLLEATMNGEINTSLLGAYVVYKLQVSPAPGSATFLDVPTGHPFFQFVEALVDAGITAGCGGGNFCPDEPLTRGQMAVFLSVALGLHFPG